MRSPPCVPFLQYGISRILLGAAEAGFFPGVLLYLTTWFPKAYMARIVAVFMVAVPLSNFIGSPLSVLLLKMDGIWDYRGWQWLLMLEALPAVIMGIATLFFSPANRLKLAGSPMTKKTGCQAVLKMSKKSASKARTTSHTNTVRARFGQP